MRPSEDALRVTERDVYLNVPVAPPTAISHWSKIAPFSHLA